MVAVIGIVYDGPRKYGDFKWMLKQPEYEDALFIYNDNVKDSLDPNVMEGGGSAAIRNLSWRFSTPPRSVGVPTGWSVASGGFDEMDIYSKKAIDFSIARIWKIILDSNSQVTKVIYSCSREDKMKIGVSIFQPHSSILNYINDQLHNLQSAYAHSPIHLLNFSFISGTHDDLSVLEQSALLPIVTIHDKHARAQQQIRILERELQETKMNKRRRAVTQYPVTLASKYPWV